MWKFLPNSKLKVGEIDQGFEAICEAFGTCISNLVATIESKKFRVCKARLENENILPNVKFKVGEINQGSEAFSKACGAFIFNSIVAIESKKFSVCKDRLEKVKIFTQFKI